MKSEEGPAMSQRQPEALDDIDPVEVLEAEAVWTFKERLLRGETPDPDELLAAFPGRRPEFEKMLAILQWGKVVLTPAAGPDAGPCREGAVIGDYRIGREVGRGGMGVVYEAEQLTLKRRVALKVLPRVLAVDSEWRRRFEREASLAAILHHTNIVPIHDFGTDQGVAYYSMELIAGASLDRILADLRALGSPPATVKHLRLLGGPIDGDAAALGGEAGSAGSLPEEAATRLGAGYYLRKIAWLLGGVAEGLHLAHQKGIIHRDVKPANLMLSPSGNLLLSDFGVARMRDGEMSTTGRLLGTPHYMSPEQAAMKPWPVDHRTDIYSLGAALYELLTLRLPFPGRNAAEVARRVLAADPAPISRLNPWVPRDLEAIVLRAMEKSPERRYPTALELSHDLRRFVLGEPVLARKPGMTRRLARKVQRHWKRMSFLAAFVLVAALGVFAFLDARSSALRYRRTRSEQLVQTAEAYLSADMPLPDLEAPPAAAYLTEALTLSPCAGRAHFLRGNARFEAGDLDEAVEDFTAAIELGAEVGPSYYRRGMALECLNRKEAASKDILTASEIAPEDGLLLFYRGVSAQADGRIPEAMDLFQRAFQRRPGLRPQAFFRLALCHHGAADYDRSSLPASCHGASPAVDRAHGPARTDRVREARTIHRGRSDRRARGRARDHGASWAGDGREDGSRPLPLLARQPRGGAQGARRPARAGCLADHAACHWRGRPARR